MKMPTREEIKKLADGKLTISEVLIKFKSKARHVRTLIKLWPDLEEQFRQNRKHKDARAPQ